MTRRPGVSFDYLKIASPADLRGTFASGRTIRAKELSLLWSEDAGGRRIFGRAHGANHAMADAVAEAPWMTAW